MTKQQIMDPGPDRRPCLIDRCATSASLTILASAALMVPVVALIDAWR